ncbi:MAG: TonB-dependent receptor [Candidatus Marinimicrobia bacterium]|nr:TonB-dependent receptor [Candidatus Neomarinimicrobiota bacterium]
MKNALLWISLLSILSSQSLTIQGIVTNQKTSQPIENVNITVGESGGVTDLKGHFSFQTTLGSEFIFSHIGYQSVQWVAQNDSFVTIELIPVSLKGNEIMVYAGLLPESLEKSASSVSVLNASQIRNGHGLHFQDIIEQIPGLNWAGGSSRPRFFQIRGMGERSQYAGEGAPNYSIGFIMDDVDLSGIGMAGFLFDLNQIEVYKGPQSSIYGPNAMGGLISLRSVDPFDLKPNRILFTLGSDQIVRGGIGFGASLSPKVAYRLSYASGQGNGFRENVFQDLKSTNRLNENIVRLKVAIKPTDKMDALLTLFQAELDNGYDAWAPDNNVELKTYTNANGADSVGTQAYSLRVNSQLPIQNTTFTAIVSQSRNDLLHSYDGDWGNDDYWLENHGFDPDVEGWQYAFYDETNRTRKTHTSDYRITAKSDQSESSIVVGVYSKVLEEIDHAIGYIFGGDATALSSQFNIENSSIYTQANYDISSQFQLKVNARSEWQKTTYLGKSMNEWVSSDTTHITTSFESRFFGGKMSLGYRPNSEWRIWSSIARGYKAGGINQHPALTESSRAFDPEFINNIEFGFRKASALHSFDFTLFYGMIDRKQVSISSQQIEGDPNSFVYYTSNASKGFTRGFEWSQKLSVTNTLSGHVHMSFLDTYVDEFEFETAEGERMISGGRSLAHAPSKQISIGLSHNLPTGIFTGLNYQYKSEFYFSDSHNQKSNAYGVMTIQMGYRKDKWVITAWAKNVLDERYATRGFYFGLEPPNYEDKLYLSYGEPRHFGFTLETEF